jgi:hypothetical protein
MLQADKLYWNKDNQICLNTILGQEDNFTVGSGSLIYDWDQPPIQDEYVNEIQIVNRKEIIMKETDFTIMCSQFKNTKFEEIYEEFKIGTPAEVLEYFQPKADQPQAEVARIQ